MLVREARLSAGRPRPRRAVPSAPRFRLQPPAAGEAEGAPYLRHEREAVPPLLSNRPAPARHDRAEPADDPRTPARQRRLPPGVFREPGSRPLARHPRSLQRQRPPHRRSVRAGERRRPDRGAQRLWLERGVRGLNGTVLREPERQDVAASLNEQLIVEFYSR